jgi:hypothetical protein
MTPTRTLTKFAPILVLAALALPSSAFGQATRTWVSGVGDDANPCSRTAPCKTFAGAISKTANGGEINCLDPGGFGGLTINKSLTIKCHYTEGGALVAGTNAFVINATANDKVTLRGLDINGAGGAGGAAPTSLTGIKVLSAKSVHIIDTEIYQFQDGIVVNPTSSSVRVLVKDSHIHNNNNGVVNAPGGAAVGFTTTTLKNNLIADNVCGASTSPGGTNASTPTTTNCGTNPAGAINSVATIDAIHNGFNDNGTGVFARGTLGIFELAYNDITGNSAFGIRRIESATVRGTTPGTNFVSNNAANDGTNASSTLAKRAAKRR